MDIEDKYLPSVEERKNTLETKIYEAKKIIYGNYLEYLRAEFRGDRPVIDNALHALPQLKENIDLYQEELDKIDE